MQVYEIDENGYFKKSLILKNKEDVLESHITTSPQGGLYKPKWVNKEWVEGLTQEEIDELNKPQVKEPSFEELQAEHNVDIDYRVSLIEMGLM